MCVCVCEAVKDRLTSSENLCQTKQSTCRRFLKRGGERGERVFFHGIKDRKVLHLCKIIFVFV